MPFHSLPRSVFFSSTFFQFYRDVSSIQFIIAHATLRYVFLCLLLSFHENMDDGLRLYFEQQTPANCREPSSSLTFRLMGLMILFYLFSMIITIPRSHKDFFFFFFAKAGFSRGVARDLLGDVKNWEGRSEFGRKQCRGERGGL